MFLYPVIGKFPKYPYRKQSTNRQPITAPSTVIGRDHLTLLRLALMSALPTGKRPTNAEQVFPAPLERGRTSEHTNAKPALSTTSYSSDNSKGDATKPFCVRRGPLPQRFIVSSQLTLNPVIFATRFRHSRCLEPSFAAAVVSSVAARPPRFDGTTFAMFSTSVVASGTQWRGEPEPARSAAPVFQ